MVRLSDTAANNFRNPHAPITHPMPRSAARLAVDSTRRRGRPAEFDVPSAFLRKKFVTSLRENGLDFIRRHNDPDTQEEELDAIV